MKGLCNAVFKYTKLRRGKAFSFDFIPCLIDKMRWKRRDQKQLGNISDVISRYSVQFSNIYKYLFHTTLLFIVIFN